MKTKIAKGMFLFFAILAVTVAVSLLTNQESSETDTTSVKQSSDHIYQFHDDAVKETIEAYLEKDANELTQADLSRIFQITYLNIEGSIQNADDFLILLPNLVGIVSWISKEADSGISNTFAQLDRLEAVKIYSNVALEPEFAKNLRYVDISYDEELCLSPDNNLTEFSQLNGERIKEEMNAPIQSYMRIRKGDMLYEMFASGYILNEEDGRTYKGERKVSVSSLEQGKGDSVQILEFSSEYGFAISNNLLLKDVNFDGNEDILIDNGHFENQGAVTFTCYLYSEEGYIKNESFSQIVNPAVDAKEKKILSNWRNSASSHGYGMFSIENGEFVETERFTIEIIGTDGEDIFSYQMEERIDGEIEEWKVTDEGILSSEQFKDQFSSEDSYWAVTTKKWRTFFEEDGYEKNLVTDQESGADQKENLEEKTGSFLGTDTEYQPKVEKSQETKEQPRTVKIEGDSLRYLVADLLSKDADCTLLEEDLIEWVGKMESSDLTLESGKDIEFAVKYFDCLHVTEITILDNLKWNDEQLQMLSLFPELTKLHFEADEKGISLDAVEKLSKLEELTLDVKDAAALQQFQIPDQVKILKLYSEQGDLYRDLLASLKDSSVTELQINIQKGGEFTLDDVAGCPSLERLYVYSGALRIQNISTNWQLNSLEYMMFTADRQTDLRFVKELPSLEYVDIAITETLDAAPLFERKELGMYLQVARPKAESEDERYPDNQVVEVGLEEYTSLEEVELQQREYLAAYQQRFDEGTRIECFVLRRGGEEDVILTRY